MQSQLEVPTEQRTTPESQEIKNTTEFPKETVAPTFESSEEDSVDGEVASIERGDISDEGSEELSVNQKTEHSATEEKREVKFRVPSKSERHRRVDVVMGGRRHAKSGKRPRKYRDVDQVLQGVTKPAIRRLARRGGVIRISGLIYPVVRQTLKTYLENTIRDAVTYTDHAKRKTVTVTDVVLALRRGGKQLYGFGDVKTPHK